MKRRKVLYVLHNHPSVRPGGAEVYGLELYEAMQDQTRSSPSSWHAPRRDFPG